MSLSLEPRQTWTEVFPVVKDVFREGGAVAFACSALLLLLYRLLPRVRRTPGWLILRAAVCEALVSIVFFLFYYFGKDKDHAEWEMSGDGVLLVLLIGLIGLQAAADAWRLLVFVDLLAIYRNPFHPDRSRMWYPLFVLFISLVVVGSLFPTSIAAIFTGIDNASAVPAHEAYMADPDKNALIVLCCGFIFVPFGLLVISGGGLYLFVRLNITSALRGGADGASGIGASHASISFLARQRVMRHATAHLLLAAAQLSAALALTLLVYLSPNLYGEEALWLAIACLVVGRPAFNLLGWLVINDVVYMFTGCCSFTKPWRVAHAAAARRLAPAWRRDSFRPTPLAAADDAATAHATGTASPRGDIEAGGRATDGGGGAAEAAARRPSATKLQGALWPRLYSMREARERRSVKLQGIEEVGFKEELRFELVYDVALGIGELAQREASLDALGAAPEPWRNSVDLGDIRRGGLARASAGAPLGTPFASPELTIAPLLADATAHAAALAAAQRSGGANGHARHRSDGAALEKPLLANGGRSPGAPRPPGAAPFSPSATTAAAAAALFTPPTAGTAMSLGPSRASSALDHGAANHSSSGGARAPWSSASLAPSIGRSASDGQLDAAARREMLAAAPHSRALHYEVEAFRRIRHHFGVTAGTYARAFPDDLTALGAHWRQRLKESVSEGASGSFFYRVAQPGHSASAHGIASRFIVKQITREEKRALMALLPAYEAHVARRRGRSLIQYYGCHSMSLRWKWSGKVYFVVMRNFLPVRSWLTFDLKGATANRRALAAKFLHQIHAGADPRGGAAYGTLRDWEWLDIAMHIDVPDAAKAELAETLQADAAFLAEQGLLDYSLLVGIHRLPPSMPPAQREARVEALAAQGGYVSRDRQKVYFFGIIDVLETYSLRWQAQRAALTAGYYALCRGADADGISAMTPDDYADRFYTFVLHEVLALPPPPGEASARAVGGARGSLSSYGRWSHLWQRRRRGLVQERIEIERADQMRRIEELEEALRAAREHERHEI